MNDITKPAQFLILTAIFYLPSLWAKRMYSGDRFSQVAFWIAMTFNVIIGHYHVKFVYSGYLPIIGEMDRAIVGWVSVAMPFIYGLTLPTPKQKRQRND